MLQVFRRIDAGFAGEQRVDFFLEKARFNGPIRIFTNVELQITPYHYIQIDSIVMSPSFIYILEIKNIKGELRFMQNPPSLHRTLMNGEELVMDCPVYQIEKNIAEFNLWLEMNGLPCKSNGAIVLAFTSSIVKAPPKMMPIFYAKQLPQFLQTMESDPPIMSLEQFDEITRKLTNANHPFNPIPLCKHYKIDKNSLMSGVFCHVCFQKMSRRNKKSWTCRTCDKDYQNPYPYNVQDWFLLINDAISVNECRKFLELNSRHSALYAIKSLNLKKLEKSTATKYYLHSKSKTLRL